MPDEVGYFWLTGILSAFLDNAPTYLVFFELAGGDPQALMTKLAPTLASQLKAAGYEPSSLNTTATNWMMSALKTYEHWTKPYPARPQLLTRPRRATPALKSAKRQAQRHPPVGCRIPLQPPKQARYSESHKPLQLRSPSL